MEAIGIFRYLTPQVAVIVALLVVIGYLFKILMRQVELNAEVAKALGEVKEAMEGTKQWIQGLLEAYKDMKR